MVIAGNSFLEQQAKEKKASKVVHLPTTIDHHRYSVKPNWNGKETVTLGWLGSPSTLKYLERILPALREVARQHPHVQLKVVSSVFPQENQLNVVQKRWSEEDEEKDLHSFDIGLAPLDEDPWCEGKCGLKLLQYMACGLPSVSSPFGGQKEIVQDGVNGYLAKDPKGWIEKVTHLITHPDERIRLGLALSVFLQTF